MIEHDLARQAFLEDQGLTVLRFSNDEVIESVDRVIVKISALVNDSTFL